METRRCSKCRETKNLTDFYRNRAMPLGRHYECKKCSDGRKNPKEFYRKHRVRLLEKFRVNRLKNKGELNIKYWTLLGRRHSISGDVLLKICEQQNKECFYCHIPLVNVVINIDHYTPKDSTKLVLTCSDCNRLKWERTGDEFQEFIKEYITRFR